MRLRPPARSPAGPAAAPRTAGAPAGGTPAEHVTRQDSEQAQQARVQTVKHSQTVGGWRDRLLVLSKGLCSMGECKCLDPA